MNAVKRHLDEQAAKGLAAFKKDMAKLCEMMQHHFSVTDEDSEHIDFELGNVPFSVTWSVGERQAIGRKIPVVYFQLIIWSQTMGGRWHPPEWHDSQVAESQSISDLMREAILCLVKDEINGCLETIAYSEVPLVHEEM